MLINYTGFSEAIACSGIQIWLWDWRPSIDTLEDVRETIFSDSERVIDSRLTWTVDFCEDHFIWYGQIVVGWARRFGASLR